MHAAKLDWVNRLPPALWLLLPVAALTPVWIWCVARLLDRSDDPLGIVALATLVGLVLRDRASFVHTPRNGWLVLSTGLAAAAVLGAGTQPALMRGVLAVLAVCAMLLALRAPRQPMLALTGLALLALPLLSSLQFFAGYPLRVVTAEASRLLLALFGVAATRDGSTLVIAGQMVMVDAPCSGIQMGWVAYYSACLAAAWLRVPDARFLRRIPLVGLAVLVGNILRNSILVLKEAQLVHWPEWSHTAVGIVAFASVCAFVLWHVARAARAPQTPVFTWRMRRAPAETRPVVTWGRLAALVALAGLALWPWLRPQPVLAQASVPGIEWPRTFEERTLQPLALSAVEQRFADRFPGAIARFSDGSRTIVLRHVLAPTRMLHPAADCYRALGYGIEANRLEQTVGTDERAVWRCFVATKKDVQLRVCENIVDARGQTFSDTSAWYWAALLGRSVGPWRAVTKTAAQ